MITVRFFAMLKGLAGAEEKAYPVEAPITIGELKELLKRDFPALRPVIDSRSVLVSVNQEFAGRRTLIKDGDEVGLLPPFSGG
ncbi:MAG: MoaD/ThiS family protein [Deltaproteobacteria bacterium]|nr:MoaD/ThiS family protein [Deltaproteobacteria bacterium]